MGVSLLGIWQELKAIVWIHRHLGREMLLRYLSVRRRPDHRYASYLDVLDTARNELSICRAKLESDEAGQPFESSEIEEFIDVASFGRPVSDPGQTAHQR